MINQGFNEKSIWIQNIAGILNTHGMRILQIRPSPLNFDLKLPQKKKTVLLVSCLKGTFYIYKKYPTLTFSDCTHTFGYLKPTNPQTLK